MWTHAKRLLPLIIAIGAVQLSRANCRRAAASERSRADSERSLAELDRYCAKAIRARGWDQLAARWDACAEQCDANARSHDERATQYELAARFGLAARSHDRHDAPAASACESRPGPRAPLRTHPASECDGEFCCVHNPSEHPLRDAPQHWRADRGLMERTCEHGIGHPDPDDLAFKRRIYSPAYYAKHVWHVHGCDGCCGPNNATHTTEPAGCPPISDEAVTAALHGCMEHDALSDVDTARDDAYFEAQMRLALQRAVPHILRPDGDAR